MSDFATAQRLQKNDPSARLLNDGEIIEKGDLRRSRIYWWNPMEPLNTFDVGNKVEGKNAELWQFFRPIK